MDNERNTVLILGAGATRAAVGDDVDIKDRPPLNADFFKIAEAYAESTDNSFLCGVYKETISIIKELAGNSSALFQSLEKAVTFMFLKATRENYDPARYRKAFYDFLFLINSVISYTTNRISVENSILYDFLLLELQKNPEPSIITFNYDLVIEKMIYEIAKQRKYKSFNFPGCYRLPGGTELIHFGDENPFIFTEINEDHSGISILKLHGSMNWHTSHLSEYPDFSAVYGIEAEISVSNTHYCLTSTMRRDKVKGEELFSHPMIIPPVSGKTHIMPNAMGAVWERAGNALENADRIIIVGYACSDLDIEAHLLLSESLKERSPELNIINSDLAIAEKYSAICDINHAKVYKSIRDWIDDPSNQ